MTARIYDVETCRGAAVGRFCEATCEILEGGARTRPLRRLRTPGGSPGRRDERFAETATSSHPTVDYRRLRSLREYVLVSQHERRVDVYTRDGRRWILDEYRTGETLRLESIGVALAVDDLYTDALGAIVPSTRAT